MQAGHFSERASDQRAAINSSDLNTLEEALRLRAASGGNIIAITVGPPEADFVLKKALMMGVDEVVRVWDGNLGEIGTLGISKVLSAAVTVTSSELTLCAARSDDLSSELVGTLIAERLGLPLITRAARLRLDSAAGRILADRKIALGEWETCTAAIPAVVTIESSTIEPRYASPLWVRRMSKQKIHVLNLNDLGIELPLPEEPIRYLRAIPQRPRTKLKMRVAGLSLKDKLAIMRGATQGAKQAKIVGETPEAAARRIKQQIDLWLRAGT